MKPNRANIMFLLQVCLLAALLTPFQCVMAGTTLSLMTFNAWGGGLNDGKTPAQTIAALRAANADIIGIQETRAESVPCTAEICPAQGPSIAADLARELGYYYYEQTASNEALWANAVLSRFPILGSTPNDLGVRIDVNGRVVYLFNIHATDFPYGPYQILRIPYGEAPFVDTSDEAVRDAKSARSGAWKLLQQDLAAAEGADLAVITGDFNEPSDRDWTARSVAAGLYPMTVPWPLTAAIEAAGFVDAWRAAHPDEVATPGFTWPSLTATDDPGTGYRDRIDFVFIRGQNVDVNQAMVVGESKAVADIVVTPWPSDHRAVVARI